MVKSRDSSLEDWLCSQSVGSKESQGRFSLDPDGARRAGVCTLHLHDVPLLVLAAAVEGGCQAFAVNDHASPRLEWRGSALGPSAELAAGLLAAHGVDAAWSDRRLDLPPFFFDRLGPLARRCRHAPLALYWNGLQIAAPCAVPAVKITPSSQARLLLVDRGIDFHFPAALPGLDVIAWVPPQLGSPWPRQLTWGPTLATTIRRVLETVREAALGKPENS